MGSASFVSSVSSKTTERQIALSVKSSAKFLTDDLDGTLDNLASMGKA